MDAPATHSKDPRKVAAGVIGARVRWGPPRTFMLRLDGLPPDARSDVESLLRTAEAMAERARTGAGRNR